jgi:hypothetical protein
VRSIIQQIALEHRRRYGYRRITAKLRRRGMQVTTFFALTIGSKTMATRTSTPG